MVSNGGSPRGANPAGDEQAKRNILHPEGRKLRPDQDHRDLHRVDRRQRQMCIRDSAFTGKVAGDSMSGEMGIGPMGSFPFKGTRA